MLKVLKWIGIGIGVLVGIVIAVAVVLYIMGGAKLNKTRQVQPLALAIHIDDAALGCPLIHIGERPFVDRAIVRTMLFNKGVLKE